MMRWRNGFPDAVVPAIIAERPLLIGDALTDAIRIEAGRPVGLPLHLRRLVDGAAAGGYGWRDLEQHVGTAIAPALAAAGASPVEALRLYVFPGQDPVRPEVVATLDPFVEPTSEERVRGIRLHTSEVVHPCNGRFGKTTSRHWAETAQRLALRAGFDGALLLDAEGWVVESTHSTPMWMRGGTWFTAPESAGGLVSTTLGLLESRGLAVEREQIRPGALADCDALVLVSALKLAMGVAALDDTVFDAPDDAAAPLRALVRTGG